MFSRVVGLSLLVLSVRCWDSGTPEYPATYPFENEAFVPEDLPASTPDFSYDPASDPGGYYYLGETCDHNTCDAVDTANNRYYTPFEKCRTIEYRFVNTWNIPPLLETQTWNCSSKGTTYSAALYFGVIDGNTICSAGECCSNTYGHVCYSDQEATALHELYSGISSVGMCDAMTEAVYCWATVHEPVDCFENNFQPGLYAFPVPCKDNTILWLLTCNVYKSTGLVESFELRDSPTYLNTLTISQQYTFQHMWPEHRMRNCLPHSYYFPDTATAADSADSSSTAADATDAASDESSNAYGFVFMMLQALLI